MYPFDELDGKYFIVKPTKRIDVDNIEYLIGRRFSIWTSSYKSLNYEEKLKVYRYILNLFEHQETNKDLEEKSFLTYGSCYNSGKFNEYKMLRLNQCKNKMESYLSNRDIEMVDFLLNDIYEYEEDHVEMIQDKVYIDKEQKIPHARVGDQNSKQKFVVVTLLTSLIGILYYKWRK